MRRLVHCYEKEIYYDLTYKKVKNINIRISKDGTVYVSANRLVPLKEIDRIVLKKADWILQVQQRLAQRCLAPKVSVDFGTGDKMRLFGEEYTLVIQKAFCQSLEVKDKNIILLLKNTEEMEKRKKAFEKEYKTFAQCVFIDSIKRMHSLFHGYNIPMPCVKARSMKTRWGSCIPNKKIITLNINLLQAPLEYIDYVAAHELAHFVVPNHSKNFYLVLEKAVPDYKERRKQLNSLHIDCSTN